MRLSNSNVPSISRLREEPRALLRSTCRFPVGKGEVPQVARRTRTRVGIRVSHTSNWFLWSPTPRLPPSLFPFTSSLSLQPRGRANGSGDQVEPASIGVDPHQDKGGSPVPSPFRLRTTIVDAPNWRPPFLSTRVGHGGRNTSVARGGTGATASLCTTQETRRNEDERRTVQRTRGWDGSRHGREGRNT